jgi:hypothetical protein
MIGSGSFSSVKMAQRRDNGDVVAVKISNKRKMDVVDRECVYTECQLL